MVAHCMALRPCHVALALAMLTSSPEKYGQLNAKGAVTPTCGPSQWAAYLVVP